MNKDEMKNDLTNILKNRCDNISFGDCMGRVSCDSCKAEAIYNAKYRKVGDDEIVVKKRQYEQLKKYNRDRKRLRLKWQQAKQDLDDIYSNGFVLLVEHHEIVDQVARETRQETAREILQMIYDKGKDTAMICLPTIAIKQLAKAYGIELED